MVTPKDHLVNARFWDAMNVLRLKCAAIVLENVVAVVHNIYFESTEVNSVPAVKS